MKRTPLNALLVVLLCAACLVSCAPAQPVPVPEQRDDGWRTGSLDEVGIKPRRLGRAVDRVHDGGYQNIHSIL